MCLKESLNGCIYFIRYAQFDPSSSASSPLLGSEVIVPFYPGIMPVLALAAEIGVELLHRLFRIFVVVHHLVDQFVLLAAQVDRALIAPHVEAVPVHLILEIK